MFQIPHIDIGVGARDTHADIQCALVPTRLHGATQRTRDDHHIMRLSVRARRLVILPLAGALVGACSCSAQRSAAAPGAAAPVATTATRSVTERDVRRLLSALSDDSLEGRMTATRGSARAARIIAAEMQRIGLAPAGDSGYFQRVPIGLRGATG